MKILIFWVPPASPSLHYILIIMNKMKFTINLKNDNKNAICMQNKTGIIDVEEGRCFVLPLNRTMVLPPQSLFDLVVKMRSGYYDIDTEIVRDYYRVVTPPISDYKTVGYYIARECAKFPTYKLERITSPGKTSMSFILNIFHYCCFVVLIK